MDVNSLYNEIKKVDKELLSRCTKLFLIKQRNMGSGVVLYNLGVEPNVQIELINIFNTFFQNSRTRIKEQLNYDVVMD
ncbi:hypothetical protein HRE31_13355, partial [Enterococcus faecalis]|nr:hypothetical protein [Enterococcus faecalis]